MTDRLTIDVPVIALKGDDLILKDPDNGYDVVWQLTHREEATGPDGPVVIVDYFTPDGVEGRHEFDDPRQEVVVRLPRWSIDTAPAAA